MRTSVIFIFLISALMADMISVPEDAASVQLAIDIATNNDTIVLARGTYTEQVNFSGKDLTLASNFLTSGDSLDISGTILTSTVGTVLQIVSGEQANLIGFTVQSDEYRTSVRVAHGDISFEDMYINESGVGLRVDTTSTVDLENVRFINNELALLAPYHHQMRHLSIQNCFFRNFRGAVDLDASGLITINIDSTQFYRSGVMLSLSQSGAFNLTNSTIQNASVHALHLRGSTQANLNNVIINNNHSYASIGGGGAVYMYGTNVDANFTDVVFSNNVHESAGAIYLQPHAPGTDQYYELNFEGCTFYGNEGYALIYGSLHTQMSIDHCTIVDNEISGNLFPTFYGEDATITLSNSILWNNGSNWIDPGYANLTVDYSILEGGQKNLSGEITFGAHNLDEEPLFIDKKNHNYALQICSPAVDNADPNGNGSDMGAKPYDPFYGNGCIEVDFDVDEFYGSVPHVVQLFDSSAVSSMNNLTYDWRIFSGSDTLHFTGLDPSFVISDPAKAFSAELTVSDGVISQSHQVSNLFFTLGDTLFVDQSDSTSQSLGTIENPFLTISEAISAGVDHDVVLVSEGVYHESINFNGKNLLIVSEFAIDGDESHVDKTEIRGNGNTATVHVRAQENLTAHLIGFSLTNGGKEYVGGQWVSGGLSIINNSALTVSSLIIRDNDSSSGSGLQIEGHSRLMGSHLTFYSNYTYSLYGVSMIRIIRSDVNLDHISINNCRTYYEYNSAMIGMSHSNVIIENMSLRVNRNMHSLVKCAGGSNLRILNSILWDGVPHAAVRATNNGGRPNYISLENIMWVSGSSLVNNEGENTVLLENIFLDNPMYCNEAANVLSIQDDSPCANLGNDGGYIGAFEPGCSPVSLLEIPPYGFAEDEVQRLSVDIFSPYVYDPDTQPQLLDWTIGGADHAYVIVVDDTIQIHPEPNWVGVDTLLVSVSDGYSQAQEEWVIEAYNQSDPPSEFALLWPINDTLFYGGSDTLIHFTWEEAVDVDGDSLSYTIYFSSADNIIDSLLSDANTVEVNLSSFPRNQEIAWYVHANDGEFSIASNQWSFTVDQTVEIKESELLPESFGLTQNYPNPFNPTTTIPYMIPFDSDVQMKIYDIRGQLVKEWIWPSHSAGWNTVHWSGRDGSGKDVDAGVYFVELRVRGQSYFIRMVYLK